MQKDNTVKAVEQLDAMVFRCSSVYRNFRHSCHSWNNSMELD